MSSAGNNNATESYLGGRDHGFSGSFCAEETFNSYVDPSMFFYVFPMNSPPAKMNSPTRQPYSYLPLEVYTASNTTKCPIISYYYLAQ